MISQLEAYLITRGDHLHSMYKWLIIILIIGTLASLIGSIIYTQVFDDDTDADEDDIKAATLWAKWGLKGFILIMVILFVKMATPTSEDIVVMSGLREITHEHLLNTTPITAAVLEKRFPEITTSKEYYRRIDEERQKDFQKTLHQIDSLNKLIDQY